MFNTVYSNILSFLHTLNIWKPILSNFWPICLAAVTSRCSSDIITESISPATSKTNWKKKINWIINVCMSIMLMANNPYIIGILDGEESDIGFLGWGKIISDESNIIFQNPKKPYIGRLNIQYCLYSQLFIPQQNN